ncbi:MAG: ATP-dependent zinc metalloprotease FtsH [Candidatus Omnitrophica bacterium]|nr:ATP-dependent zinc metalloprotease FtsH [Candidatus Omnitrophota bacterium]
MSDEQKQSDDKKNQESQKPSFFGKYNKTEKDRNKIIFFALLIVSALIVMQLFLAPEIVIKKLSYSEFYNIVARNRETGKIESCELVENQIRGKFQSGVYFQVNVAPGDLELIPLLRENIPEFTVNPPKIFWRNMLYSLLPVLFLIAFFYFFIYRGAQKGGGGLLSFGKSRARQLAADKNRITFKDVAGVDEAKEELQEIIEFLKDPHRFQKLGGRIPKGVLLMGHPGTGKTLLAKAVAGEAEVPFFSISGSDFVEMFVGVGASRVRDLFEKAKKCAKTSGKGSIIFIDEIDAVGRQRFAGVGGGHDEREQTLNALLSEMDGFDTQEGVILIGATNRPDVLDSALMRPGRFDRQIVVDRPDINGREAILKVHVRNVTLAKDMDFKRIAQQTSGFSGADLANLVNEAALLAARFNKETVGQDEMETSIEKVMAGPERKSRVISKGEKKITAYHESGHALIGLLLKDENPLHKVTIIPRGRAMGYTMQLPFEDRYLKTKKELIKAITILLGGRVAEEVALNDISSGALDDIDRATDCAKMMVCVYGMSERMGSIKFGRRDREIFLGRDMFAERDYSEQTAITIDEEVKRIIDECKKNATELLAEHRDKLDTLAKALLEREVLDGDEVRKIVGVPLEEDSDIYDKKKTKQVKKTQKQQNKENKQLDFHQGDTNGNNGIEKE